MPDWKPGMQNHRKVAVYFKLPVIFVSNDWSVDSMQLTVDSWQHTLESSPLTIGIFLSTVNCVLSTKWNVT
jgi:hypothetical protein